MSSAVRAIASRAIGMVAVAALGLTPVAMAAGSIDELTELNMRAWAGERELLDEVYAPEGVHTATYYDQTLEYTGPEGIEPLTGRGKVELIGPRIEIPSAEGEWRWAVFSSLAGGTACLIHAVDGLMTRHDCVLPLSTGGFRNAVGLADAEATAAIDEVQARLSGSWGPDTSVERLAEVYAPDAVHTARYLHSTRHYTGPEEILRVARYGGTPVQLGERVDFDAPEGELAWAEVVDVAGGSVCLYRAVDGLITRHDCVLPVSG